MSDFQDTLSAFPRELMREDFGAFIAHYSCEANGVVTNHVFHGRNDPRRMSVFLQFMSLIASILLLVAVGVQYAQHVKNLQLQTERWAKLNSMSKRCLVSEYHKRERACSVYDELHAKLVVLRRKLLVAIQQSPLTLEATIFDTELFDLIGTESTHKEVHRQRCTSWEMALATSYSIFDTAKIGACVTCVKKKLSLVEWLDSIEPAKLDTNTLEHISINLERFLSRVVQVKAVRNAAIANSCVVCLDGARDVLLLDCMHLVVCSNCSVTMKECPVCRLAIRKKVVVYSP